jgi:hypothetical protein
VRVDLEHFLNALVLLGGAAPIIAVITHVVSGSLGWTFMRLRTTLHEIQPGQDSFPLRREYVSGGVLTARALPIFILGAEEAKSTVIDEVEESLEAAFRFNPTTGRRRYLSMMMREAPSMVSLQFERHVLRRAWSRPVLSFVSRSKKLLDLWR